MNKVSIPVLTLAFILTSCAGVWGQTYDHGNMEFAMMGGVTVLSEQDGDDDMTAIGIPYVVPGFRMSYWASAPLTVDFGVSLLTLSIDDDNITAFNPEVGISKVFRSADNNLVPFVGGLAGMLSFSNGDSESGFYVGGQGGIKVFFKDHAAVRVQAGYRYMLDDELEFSALEIAAGLSFFL